MVAAIVHNPLIHARPANNSVGTQVNDILGKYGLPGGLLGAQIDALMGNQLGALNNLKDAFQEAALGRGTTGLERMLGRPLPPSGFVPSPAQQLANHLAPNGYATVRHQMDLAPGHSDSPLARLFDPARRNAAQFEAALNKSPFLKAAFERAIGGKVIADDRTDGKLTIERKIPRPRMPALPGLQLGQTAAGLLGAMDHAIQSQLGGIAGAGQAAGSFGLGALQSLLGGLGGGLNSLPGVGGGSWNPNARPGLINNNGRAEENKHQAEIDSLMKDPSLSVEDKITLMLMLIMKKMDKDIEAQGQHINQVQQQQNKQGANGQAAGASNGGGGILGSIGGLLGGAAGTALGGPIGGMLGGQLGGALGGAANNAAGGAAGGAQGGESSSPSIDIETTKLKRMMDKRSQMFDMLRQIIDKYNETAKGMIQSIGR